MQPQGKRLAEFQRWQNTAAESEEDRNLTFRGKRKPLDLIGRHLRRVLDRVPAVVIERADGIHKRSPGGIAKNRFWMVLKELWHRLE